MAASYSSGAIINLDPPRQVIDVKAYGATGDGKTNDYSAVASAIAAAEALYDQTVLVSGTNVPSTILNTYPGSSAHEYYSPVLYFPPGRYNVGNASASLTVTRPLRVMGAGYNESVLLSDQNRPLLQYLPNVTVNASTLMIRARFEDMGFRGSHQYRNFTSVPTAQDGLYLEKPSGATINTYVTVSRCQFFALGGSGIHSSFATSPDGDKFIIDGCYIYACANYGIRFDDRHSTAYITHNHLTNNAGGIGLFGSSTQPVSTIRILDNIIEANDNGPNGGTVKAGDVAGGKPFMGVYLLNVNFAEIRGNYFEWHVNSVYVGDGCRNVTVARNWFDGNDVNLPGLHYAATSSPIDHQLSPVYVKKGAGTIIGVVIEENDCYVPTRPSGTAVAQWSPSPNSWADTYEVFPVLEGTQHELIRNSARENGGRRKDVTYAAAAVNNVFFESVQWVTAAGDVVQSREATYNKIIQAGNEVRLVGPYHSFESVSGSAGAYNQTIYPVGLTDSLRAHHILQRRNADQSLTTMAELWYATDLGMAIPRTGFVLQGQDFVMRRVDTGTAAPTTGTGVVGAIRFNEAPSELGSSGSKYTVLGWRCVAAGTPGTWVEMRTLTGN